VFRRWSSLAHFFYSDGHEGYKEFKGELVEGLTLADSAETLRKKFGKSPRSKGWSGAAGA
jgi:hypothetical protein